MLVAVFRSGGVHPAVGVADPEAVRELLSRYFEVARTVIGRYGGGGEVHRDAVMAVWGTLVAAERTARAWLDLVAAVAELGAEAEEQDRPGSGVALWSDATRMWSLLLDGEAGRPPHLR